MSTIAQPVPQDYFETIVAESLKVPARVWRTAISDLLEADQATQIRDIEAPTLVLWGDRDSFVPGGEQSALISAIPDSRLLIYSGAGHALHWEEPERFAADLMKFINERIR